MRSLPRPPESLSTPLDALRALRALAAPLRLRVLRDAEGWPVIPGRLGAIEYHDGQALAVYTDRPRCVARILGLPGVRPWQVGDTEARGLFPVAALPRVAGLIRARRRRRGNAGSFQTPRLRAASAA